MENKKKIKEPFDPEKTPQPPQIIEPDMQHQEDRDQPATPNEKDPGKNENRKDTQNPDTKKS